MKKSKSAYKRNYPNNLLLDMGLDRRLIYRVVHNDQCINNIEFAVTKLTKAQQQIIELRYKQHMSYQQIAETWGILETSVSRHCTRILNAMADDKEFIVSGLNSAPKAKKKKSKPKKTNTSMAPVYKTRYKKCKRWVWDPKSMDESVRKEIYGTSSVFDNALSVQEDAVPEVIAPEFVSSEVVAPKFAALRACISEVESDASSAVNLEYTCESEWVALSRLENIISVYPRLKASYDRHDLADKEEFLKLTVAHLESYLERKTFARLLAASIVLDRMFFQIGDLLAMDENVIQKLLSDADIDESRQIEIQNGIISMIEDFFA